MEKERIMFRKKVAFVLLFSIVLISKGISAEEVYSPYPIVFVHGFNADSQSWHLRSLLSGW